MNEAAKPETDARGQSLATAAGQRPRHDVEDAGTRRQRDDEGGGEEEEMGLDVGHGYSMEDVATLVPCSCLSSRRHAARRTGGSGRSWFNSENVRHGARFVMECAPGIDLFFSIRHPTDTAMRHRWRLVRFRCGWL